MTTSKQSTLVFVPLREDHLQAIMTIEEEAYPEPWTLGMFRGEIRNERSYFCVALAEEEIVGYAGFWLVLDEIHITSVTTVARLRDRGFGREQALHLLAVGEERGALAATLEVRESNRAARRLYDGLGFHPVGLRKGYYSKTNEDAIVMRKDLGEGE